MKGLFIISAVDKGAFVLRFCIRKLRWCCHIEYTSLKEKIRVTPKTILSLKFSVCVNLKQFLVGHAKRHRL